MSDLLNKWHKVATEMGFEKQLAISREKSSLHFNRKWIIFHAQARLLNKIHLRKVSKCILNFEMFH